MRVQDTFKSINRGVSEQAIEKRISGQHTAQDNMVSDVVHGLTRRSGSISIGEYLYDTSTTPNHIQTTAVGMREFSYMNGGVEYSVLYHAGGRLNTPVMPTLAVYDKTNSAFRSVVKGSTTPGNLLSTLDTNGVASVTALGRYVLFAARGFVPTYSVSNPYNTYSNAGVAWIKLGLHSTTYSIGERVKSGAGSPLMIQLTTPAPAYQGTLDTSDILSSDPEYTKKVTDRTNAYTSAVTAWISSSADAIRPARVAETLYGFWSGSFDVEIGYSSGHIFYKDSATETFVCGGDGIGAWGQVYNTVESTTELSAYHIADKVVKVLPNSKDELSYYYVKAIPTDNILSVVSGLSFRKVRWVEGAGEVVTPTSVFAIGTVVGGTFYLANTPSELASMTGLTDVPVFSPSTVGDTVVAPVPLFLTQPITYLDVFADRLLIGTGTTAFLSRSGDYFNWFRQSMLTVIDTDPAILECYTPLEDTLRNGVVMDRNLIILGDRYQYVIRGDQLVSPKTSVLSLLSNYPEICTDVAAVGDSLFYGTRGSKANMHQMQPGQYTDTPQSTCVSVQLDKYIVGTPTEVRTSMSPNTVFLRSTGLHNGLYVYIYLDTSDGRVDSWSRWYTAPELGSIAGTVVHNEHLIVFSLRHSLGYGTYICADKIPLAVEGVDRPHMDSQRLVTQHLLNTGWCRVDSAKALTADLVYSSGDTRYLIGARYSNADTELLNWRTDPDVNTTLLMGWTVPGTFTVTNPFVRNRQGDAKLGGRTTLTRYLLSVQDSGGLTYTVSTPNGVVSQGVRDSAIIGFTAALDTVSLSTGVISVPVGYEVRECEVTFSAQQWLPLTITSIGWVGQHFLR